MTVNDNRIMTTGDPDWVHCVFQFCCVISKSDATESQTNVPIPRTTKEERNSYFALTGSFIYFFQDERSARRRVDMGV